MSLEMPVLTDQTYHSNEANKSYMSVSQFKDFRECEARAVARLNGWVEPPSDALLLGSYVHAGIEGEKALERFWAANPGLVSSKGPTKGQLKAAYKNADVMLQTLRNDPFCMFVLDGDKEVILTAEMFGVPWKIKIDAYNQERGRLADLKTTRNIRGKVWSDRYGGYVSFVEAYDYLLQIAVYCEVESLATGRDEWLEPLMVAVSNEETPDKAIIRFDEHRLRLELEVLEANLQRVLEVKYGAAEPLRCEKCQYCRETKRLRGTIHYTELIG
ncbi:PD-(D/E)XK nuclease-like domain-containing protein [Cohnella sp. GCM10020058]|uniref:PD-(D/E)XK nuclease-like domain-containing protein n=1 Tax=Cohnella sp. GCM10020058 TaxID=3317330 RepID=UPI003632130F